VEVARGRRDTRDTLRWQRRILGGALAVVFGVCLVLARRGQDGGALLVAGYALLWYTLIRMLVLGPEPELPLVRHRSSSP
jgi:hypothetical protein